MKRVINSNQNLFGRFIKVNIKWKVHKKPNKDIPNKIIKINVRNNINNSNIINSNFEWSISSISNKSKENTKSEGLISGNFSFSSKYIYLFILLYF